MFLRFIRKSLRLKLILASVIVELIMLTILLGNSLRIINTTIDEQSAIKKESITPLLDSALSISLFERDFATLFELLEKLHHAKNSEFDYIEVYDDQGRLYAQLTQHEHPTNQSKISTDKLLHISSPLTLGGETIGEVKYGLSIQSLYESKSSLLKQGIFIALFEIVLTILLLGITSYFLTRHLTVLLQSSEEISSGNYEVKVPVKTLDEIGLLANGFNIMAKAVRDRIAVISETSNSLNIKSAKLESIYNSIADGVIFVDINRVCVSVNPAMITMFGYPLEKFINRRLDFIYLKKEEYDHQGQLRFSIDAPDRKDSFEASYVRKDGSVFIGELLATRVKDDKGNILGFIGILRDINQRKKTELELMEAKERALVTLESIGDAVITTDEKGLVQYLNPVAENLTGWLTVEAQNKPLPEIFDIYNEKTNQSVENPVLRCLRENIIINLANQTVLINKKGKKLAIEDSAAPIRNKQGKILGVILVFHDVSHSREMAAQLSWQASHDSLTGLINRLEFEIRLDNILKKKNTSSEHALLYMDLDQFKVVNDTCGHIAGDELLKQLTTLFQNHIRDNDTLARLGGDEFGILLENCPSDRAIKIAEGIVKNLGRFRFSWLDKVFSVGVSIGLVSFKSSNTETISTLMSAADIACYAAKDAGRNRIHIYKLDDDKLVQRHGEMQWVSQIQHALENEMFELYCQPIVSTSTQSIEPHHYEILIRMHGMQSEIFSPMAFLPAAERYNLMPEIDRWVITHVLEQIKRYPLAQGTMIAINLSGNSLSDDNFLNFVITELQNSKIDARQFCFEVTETAAISNLGQVTSFISTLQKLGSQFSLDDFGSGLSSFAYLKNLNVDYLKIDGAFVKDMVSDPIDRSMVEAINKIGHVMKIKTIAEFVEDKETYEMLTSMNVNYVQGYYFSKPFPFSKLK